MGSDGDSFETYRTAAYDTVALSDITALSYSTYADTPGSGGQAPYLRLNIDYDADTALRA